MIAMYRAAAAAIGNPNVSARGNRWDPTDFLSHSVTVGMDTNRASRPFTLRLVGVEDSK